MIDTKTIIAGDFNSNAIWDKKFKICNHSDVVAFLKAKSIYSTYHTDRNQIQGKEEDPTSHLYRHFDKPYHIDYIFAS